jgi:hypothetical protein
MKPGDLVMDDRSHMDESNWFWNAFRRLGVVMAVREEIEVLWTNERGQWTTHERPSRLVVISESR